MGPPRDRDEEWFTASYADHHTQIVKYGLRRLGDADAAVELAQEVFVVAWRRRVEVPDHSLPWLYGVARRLLANHWRARRAAPLVVPVANAELPHGGPAVEQDDRDAAVELAAVRTALVTLSDLDQEILRLVGWEGLTVGEAATVLGCTRTTAGVRLHRARRRLAAALTTSTPVHRSYPAAVRL